MNASPARVHCRHLAALGEDRARLGACTDPACPTPLSEGPWTFAGPGDVFQDVLVELADGRSLAGALLLVAERRTPGQALLLADGEQVAAVASGPGVRVRTLGGGAYAVAAGPVGEPAAWSDLPAGTVLLLDPCGVTTTPLLRSG